MLAGGGGSPHVLARPTRRPAAASRATAQTDLNTPARASRSPRAGCTQGALVSDPRESSWGISIARKVHASEGARKVLVKHLAKLQTRGQELQSDFAYLDR